MTSIAEEAGTAKTATAAEKPNKKARAGARRVHVAPSKAKVGKARRAKKANKTAPKSTPTLKASSQGKAAKQKGVREGSKTETIVGLLKRPEGVTLNELMKAAGWQAHSVRGFLSGTVRKKLGLTVASAKGEDGERTYSVKA